MKATPSAKFGIIACLVVLAACARPIPPLPGEVTAVEVIVPDGQIAILDWASVRAEVARRGYTYKRRPLMGPKPTPAEIAAQKEVDAHNAEYRAQSRNPEVLSAVQDRAIEGLEGTLLYVAKTPFGYPGAGNDPVNITNRGGPPLKLVVRPSRAVLTIQSSEQESTGQAALGVAAVLIGGQGAAPMPFWSGSYSLTTGDGEEVISSGRFRERYQPQQASRYAANVRQWLVQSLWVEVARAATPSD